LLGRAAELARPQRIIAAGLPAQDLTNLIGSVQRVFGNERMRKAAAEHGDEMVQRHHDELLRTTLPVKLRSRLEKMFANLGPRDVDLERFLAANERAADRAGLLLSGDARSAFAHAGSMSAQGRRHTRHLSDMVLGPDYLAIRSRLGDGLKK
jgi:hypothetical protein